MQDDRRYAASYVHQRSERGYGPRRIEQELRQRGVDPDIAAEAMAASDTDWLQRACAAQAKKFRAAPQSHAERAKQSRFLEYRGFDAEQIRHALSQASDNEDL